MPIKRKLIILLCFIMSFTTGCASKKIEDTRTEIRNTEVSNSIQEESIESYLEDKDIDVLVDELSRKYQDVRLGHIVVCQLCGNIGYSDDGLLCESCFLDLPYCEKCGIRNYGSRLASIEIGVDTVNLCSECLEELLNLQGIKIKPVFICADCWDYTLNDYFNYKEPLSFSICDKCASILPTCKKCGIYLTAPYTADKDADVCHDCSKGN